MRGALVCNCVPWCLSYRQVGVCSSTCVCISIVASCTAGLVLFAGCWQPSLPSSWLAYSPCNILTLFMHQSVGCGPGWCYAMLAADALGLLRLSN